MRTSLTVGLAHSIVQNALFQTMHPYTMTQTGCASNNPPSKSGRCAAPAQAQVQSARDWTVLCTDILADVLVCSQVATNNRWADVIIRSRPVWLSVAQSMVMAIFYP